MTDDSLARARFPLSQLPQPQEQSFFRPPLRRVRWLSVSISLSLLHSLFRPFVVFYLSSAPLCSVFRGTRDGEGEGRKEQRPPPQSHTKSLTPHNSPLTRRDVLLGPSRVDICMCNGEDSSSSLSLLNGEFTLASSSSSVALLPRVDTGNSGY